MDGIPVYNLIALAWIILCGISVYACIRLVYPLAVYVGGNIPKSMSMARGSQKIHDWPEDETTMQSSQHKPRNWGLLGRCLGVNRAPVPGAELNKRPVTALQKLQSKVHGRSLSSKPFSDALGDRAALCAFFVATSQGDRSWMSEQTGSGREGWLDPSLSVGDWQGVSVSGEGGSGKEEEEKGKEEKGQQSSSSNSSQAQRVIKLFLPRINIQGPLTELAPLSALTKLSLWDNAIDGTLDPLRDLVCLRELDVSQNKLSGTLDALVALFDLEELNVGDNELDGTLHAVGNLRSLTRLVLKNNAFRGSLDGLAPCVKLQTIDLSGNEQLSGEVPPWIYEKWVQGHLPLNSTGTHITATAPPKKEQAAPTADPDYKRPVTAFERRATLRASQLQQMQELQKTLLNQMPPSMLAGGGGANSSIKRSSLHSGGSNRSSVVTIGGGTENRRSSTLATEAPAPGEMWRRASAGAGAGRPITAPAAVVTGGGAAVSSRRLSTAPPQQRTTGAQPVMGTGPGVGPGRRLGTAPAGGRRPFGSSPEMALGGGVGAGALLNRPLSSGSGGGVGGGGPSFLRMNSREGRLAQFQLQSQQQTQQRQTQWPTSPSSPQVAED